MRFRLSIFCAFSAVSVFAQADLGMKASQILRKNCLGCHGAALKMSGLDLRTRESILTGGSRGPAVTPTNPQRSLLMKLVTHEEKPTMPPEQKLSDADIDVLNKWIEAGAMLGEVSAGAAQLADDRKAAMAKMEERQITAEER